MKKGILFVDDEPNIIQGLRRMFHSMRNEWTMFFATSGEEALEILSQNQIDIVVSDMRMPNMDGAELLNRVQEIYPNTIRIILSGHSDEAMILKSTKSTHQFLAKPINPDILKSAIAKACLLRDTLKSDQIVKLVTGIKTLPSLPNLYYKLIEELQAEESSIKKIGDIISSDIAMTAKILQFVNSAFFGLPQHIANPHQAVSLLGINLIKSLIVSIGVFSSFKVHKNFSLESLWEHSMFVGRLAQEITKDETRDYKKSEDAMFAGLLHDIGKLLIFQLEDYSKKIGNITLEKGSLIHEAEYEIFGASHAEIGAYLLGLWGIPDIIIESVAYHHNPSKLIETGFSILTAVHISNAFFSNKDQSTPIELSAYLDINYIRLIGYEKKLNKWKEMYSNIKEKGSFI